MDVLITGGAGFIGSNLAARLLASGANVTIFDNLQRSGTSTNLIWLQQQWGPDRLTFIRGDLRDFNALRVAADGKSHVYHLAAQVAVTTSVADPRRDFEDNAIGTFNALEAARLSECDPVFLYTSTNKVYGEMERVAVVETPTRYEYTHLDYGISELQPLDFHSPYGCSKGCGDQYVHDYARIYRLRTIVMRQSCIYGYRQFGIEDQGWVAWFIIAALKQRPITIFGDGKQVRDILFIDDLLHAYELAVKHIDITAGNVYNIGGGASNTMSIWNEFSPILEELLGHAIQVEHAGWRQGDQKIYVSDIRRAQEDFNWTPHTSVRDGISRLFAWIKANQYLFAHI